jgi:hypothetical protein
LHPSASQRSRGGQRLVLEAGGHQLQLVGGRSSTADVAGRDLDLHLRLEQRGSLQIGVGRSFLRRHPQRTLECVPDRGSRDGRVSLGQAHERETRLGVPSGAMTGQQGVLRAREISLVQADPPELVQRPAEFPSQVGAQLIAGNQRLALRLVARPA